MNFKTADLCDQFHTELKISRITFVSFGGKKRFSGPMATVQVFEDNVLIRQAIETLPTGTVLVIDGGASKRCAVLGGQLAALAVSRGLAGVIINGCVRDVAELSKLDIGILALGSTPLRSLKEGHGERDIVLYFGGIDWTPGHFIYVDEDGVVIAPRPLQ